MGRVFKAAGIFVYILSALWGLAVCFGVVAETLGTFWAVASLFLAPFLLGLAPWYDLIAHGNWTPVFIVYGGGVAATVLRLIGLAIDNQLDQN